MSYRKASLVVVSLFVWTVLTSKNPYIGYSVGDLIELAVQNDWSNAKDKIDAHDELAFLLINKSRLDEAK
ncbi:MAG: hypothetical protein AAF705_20510, partial [Bacteroidota bacterium]